MKYSVFANLFKEAKLPYESCKKIKELIKKGKKIDFNDRNLSVAINKFENPLAFAQNYTSTRLPQPYKNNLHKELEKILKKIESKSQENIQEFKRALKSVDELNSFETTPTTQDIKQTLQNNKGQLLIKDEKGKNHFINEKLVKAWQDEFKLANAQDDFLPEFSPQIKDILAKNGVNEIHLKIGSLVKINARDRGEFIKHIKPTLQEPNALIRQNDGALIFVKDVNEKKFFASVAKNERGEWVITSNAPKTLSNLKNKINDGGELLHSDLPELSIIAQPELTAKALNGEANADEIIPNSKGQSQVKASEKELENIF